MQRVSILEPSPICLHSIAWLPSCPTFEEVEAIWGSPLGSTPPVAGGSLQMAHIALITHHQAIIIGESDQTSWLIRHRELGEGVCSCCWYGNAETPTVFVLPADEHAMESTE